MATVKPQYQAVSIWEIMEIRTLVGGLWVPPPPSPPPDGDEEAGAMEADGEEETRKMRDGFPAGEGGGGGGRGVLGTWPSTRQYCL